MGCWFFCDIFGTVDLLQLQPHGNLPLRLAPLPKLFLALDLPYTIPQFLIILDLILQPPPIFLLLQVLLHHNFLLIPLILLLDLRQFAFLLVPVAS